MRVALKRTSVGKNKAGQGATNAKGYKGLAVLLKKIVRLGAEVKGHTEILLVSGIVDFFR